MKRQREGTHEKKEWEIYKLYPIYIYGSNENNNKVSQLWHYYFSLNIILNHSAKITQGNKIMSYIMF